MAVRQLRQVLEDDPKSPRFIETVPRIGYRWVAPVESRASSRSSAPPSPPSARRRTPWLLASLWLLAPAAGWLFAHGATDSGPALEEPWRPLAGASAAELREEGAQLAASPGRNDRIRGLRLLAEAHRREPQDAESALLLAEAGYSLRWRAPASAVLRWTDEPARRAAALDPQLARPHLILGDLEFRFHRRWTAARHHYETATRLDPTMAQAWQHLGLLELAEGRFDAAEAALLHASALDGEGSLAGDLTYALLLRGDLERADAAARKALDQQRGSMFDVAIAVEVLRSTDPNRALAEAGDVMTRYGVRPAQSQHEWWAFLIDWKLDLDAQGTGQLSEIALHHWRTGERDAAIQTLREACRLRAGWSLPFVDVDPRFAELRRHARFDCPGGPGDAGRSRRGAATE